ncbi:UDP-glucose 4-epimerase family protein [Zooshikella ganghwensis]|uniref:NAD-dependent epimerase/dehydratase family protein n=1 Tax=Zooshikella ganghwensis TaxID=202772 RepID=A0A4P9VIY6_9GAMM|nr:SDR family oxidoreductase [Zooshikella ganghwensis]RDH43163.1 NAD-dependent epimerase/dehydratase family protein [Zooshikella ganghwensis]
MNNSKNLDVLVTGANGFLGSALCSHLLNLSANVKGAVRNIIQSSNLTLLNEEVAVGDINGDTSWQNALAGVNTVVHTAARVHVMSDTVSDPLNAFREVNVAGTLNLAKQAVNAGVKRFVFISSIKVNGEETTSKPAFTAEDKPAPSDPYGISKYEAEQGLFRIAEETGLEVVVIRPPLVYGPGVKANFLSLMRWIYKGVPLPLGAAVHNQRSLIALDNLVDLIVTCIQHPAAVNQVFLASDDEDLSTTDLLYRISDILDVKARLLPIPTKVLEIGATVIGKREFSRRLLGSLQVDISKNKELLDWEPPVKVNSALEKTVEYFMKNNCCKD